MRKKLAVWVASFALIFGLYLYANHAEVHNEAQVTPYGSCVTKDELSVLKKQTKALYEKELFVPVEEPMVAADTDPGYSANRSYGPGSIIILKTKMPYEEKLVYRYTTYVRENSNDKWTRLKEYQNTDCNSYDC
ncbi:MAG: hypothetical protein Q4F05_07955 [bacterium]|nr:hypothetical protein [bacterium]